MTAIRWVRRALLAFGVLVGLCLAAGEGVGEDNPKSEKKAKDDKKGKGKGAEKGPAGTTTITLQIDASKLPPDVLKALIAASQGGKGGPAQKGPPKKDEPKAVKAITLTEAIGIAEKIRKGTATKAERKGEGADLHFKIDVVDKDGNKQKVELDASGKPLGEGPEKKGPPGPEKKLPPGLEKKKGKDDDPKKGKKDDD